MLTDNSHLLILSLCVDCKCAACKFCDEATLPPPLPLLTPPMPLSPKGSATPISSPDGMASGTSNSSCNQMPCKPHRCNATQSADCDACSCKSCSFCRVQRIPPESYQASYIPEAIAGCSWLRKLSNLSAEGRFCFVNTDRLK